MGNFEAGRQKERRLEWGVIEFSSKDHITVTTSSMVVVFHRFGTPKGYYTKQWGPFRREIKRGKLKSIYDVYRYANNYDIAYFVKRYSLGDRYKNTMKGGE